MAGRPKRILVAGLASLFAAGTVFGYVGIGSTAVQAAEERSERGGITLSDEECEIYDRLYDKIIKIASDGGSTSDMLTGKKMTLSWSYEELGLSSSASDSSCRTEALKALRTSLNKVRDALIAECPYELYWFDKTTGYSYSYRTPERNQDTVSVEIANIKFAVSEAYQLGGNVNKVSAVKAMMAERTVAYAQEIVEKYRDASDYDKLSGYKDEVCRLADYDDTITESSAVPYGDAWQIIYVFDQKPETKVVCEAYAKAFQYLCDQTEFDDPEIDCSTVSGTMNGIVHMWNIVTMPDGRNYIVDPTNCDEGTLSALSGGIFLAGGTGDITNGYQVMGYPYRYDENIIEDYGTGESVLAIASTAYVPGTEPEEGTGGEGQNPAETRDPAETKDPVETTDPTETENPADTKDPAEIENPDEVKDPAETADPGEVKDPAETEDPADTKDPAAQTPDEDVTDTEDPETKDPAEDGSTDDGKDDGSQTDQEQKTAAPASDSGNGSASKVTVTPKTQSAKPSSSTAKTTSQAPKTGDTSELLMWSALLTLAGGAGITLTLSRKRES